jgi:hypothetical protein
MDSANVTSIRNSAGADDQHLVDATSLVALILMTTETYQVIPICK